MLHICEENWTSLKNVISSEHYILAGNVAKVQDLIHGMDYIFLFGQLLCCATQTASLVHVTLHALPQPIRIHRISTVTNCTMAGHWCGAIPPGYKQDTVLASGCEMDFWLNTLMTLHQG